MTVRELLAQLQQEDPDRIVVMASDSEGNSHSPLARLWRGAYKAETTWSGEVGLEKLTKEDRDQGYCEDDVLKGQPALVLRPVR